VNIKGRQTRQNGGNIMQESRLNNLRLGVLVQRVFDGAHAIANFKAQILDRVDHLRLGLEEVIHAAYMLEKE